MFKDPLLSVIVPVYNVENYIRECLQSLINQYYSNLDILLIDDGSKDKSSQICDEYAHLDDRIRVFHQVNQGLAKARNVGLENAKGEYITFLDSDDFLDIEMYSSLMDVIKKYDVQIAACGMQLFCDGEIPEKCNVKKNVKVYSREEVIKRYLYPQHCLDVVSCNKIFDRKLFQGITYPEGRLFEDFVPITKTILNADRIASTNMKLYYYRQRTGSINNQNFNVKKMNPKIMDLDLALNEVLEIIEESNQELLVFVIPGVLVSKISIVNQMIYAGKINKKYVREVQAFVAANRRAVKSCPYISRTNKTKIMVFQYFLLYALLYKVYKKRRN